MTCPPLASSVKGGLWAPRAPVSLSRSGRLWRYPPPSHSHPGEDTQHPHVCTLRHSGASRLTLTLYHTPSPEQLQGKGRARQRLPLRATSWQRRQWAEWSEFFSFEAQRASQPLLSCPGAGQPPVTAWTALIQASDDIRNSPALTHPTPPPRSFVDGNKTAPKRSGWLGQAGLEVPSSSRAPWRG